MTIPDRNEANEAVWLFCEHVGGGGFYFCSNCATKLHGGTPTMSTCHSCGAHMLSDIELAERRKAYFERGIL